MKTTFQRVVLLGFLPIAVFWNTARAQTSNYSLSVVPNKASYTAGATTTFTVSMGYTVGLSGLVLGFDAPTGWEFGTLVASGASVPAIAPTTRDRGHLEFVYSAVPPVPGPVAFTFTMTAPASANTTQTFRNFRATFADDAPVPNETTIAIGDIVLPLENVLRAVQAVAVKVLPVGATATAFTPVTATGGTSPYEFAVLPTLPAGLGMNTATGEISGTPSVAAAETTHTVTVTDSASPSATATNTFKITVAPKVTVTWTAPAAIVYGTALSAAQLNATTGVDGAFAYMPPAGTVLDASATPQVLSVTFTPTDTASYTTATASTTIVVNKGGQAITFPAPSDKVYGTAPFNVTATASSGLPVNFAMVSGPASLSASTVTITGAGSVTLRATQAGNPNYNEAIAVDRTFTVSKAILTVTASSQTRSYGAANPSLGVTYSGFVNGETAVVLTADPTASTTAVIASVVGSYPITPSGGVAGNYAFTYSNGTLSVTKAPLIAKANDQTRTVGSANPLLTVTYTGFVNGDTASAIDTAPAISTTATTASPAGNYPITLTGGVDNNYTFVLQSGTLVISPIENTPPTISDIANQSIWVNTNTGPLNFSVGDAETPPANLTLSAASTNLILVPNANIVFGGTGANRTVTVTPESNQTGTANIAITVTDGGGLTAVDGFSLTVSTPPSSFAARTLPAYYAAGQDVTVTIQAAPVSTVQVYAVEDGYPDGWTFKSVGSGGQHDSANRKVKFGPFFDNLARTLTYVVTAPSAATGAATFSGTGSADGVDSPINGQSALSLAPNLPADKNPADWRITINEVTAYGAAWKRGDIWSVEPNPIPIGYVTRAGLIWKGGEVYHFDVSVSTPPLWWVSGAAASLPAALPQASLSMPPPAVQAALAASTSIRSISQGTVTVTVTPDAVVGVYAVEELIPTGLSPSAINNAGSFDTVNRKVKWGPFFDNTVRALSYTVTGAASDYTLSGVASFDGTDLVTTGSTTVKIGDLAIIALTANPTPGGAVTGGGTFVVGSSQSISATANSGYYFTGWSDGNTSATRSIIVLAGGVTLTANFAPISLAVTPSSANVAATGGPINVGIEMAPAGIPAVTSNAAWLPIPTIASGAQPQWSVVIVVPSNPGAERTGTVAVTVHGLTREVNVAQAAVFVPLPPLNVVASDGLNDRVAISWSAVSGASGYDIYRAPSNNGAVAVKLNATPISGSTFDDTTGTVGVVYYYFVKSRNGTVESISFSVGDAGQRTPLDAPVITVPPVSRVVRLGGSTTFAATATGSPPLNYQWSLNGAPLAGANAATYVIESAQYAHAGTYTVAVSNLQQPPASAIAQLSVVDAKHSATIGGYAAGGTISVTVRIVFAGPAVSLALDALLPDGWSYAGGTGEPEGNAPVLGTTGVLGWSWTTVPASPVEFSYRLSVPAGETGSRSIRGRLILRQASGVGEVLMLPDPLVLSNYHSADTSNGATPRGLSDFQIDLFELTRVIELYNTRKGTVRTGCYQVDPTGEDGFGADASRNEGTTATLARYHSADTRGATTGTPRDGAIDLFELTRVIELYNYRVGTVRTGEYHVHSGSEDGFAPGPISGHPDK